MFFLFNFPYIPLGGLIPPLPSPIQKSLETLGNDLGFEFGSPVTPAHATLLAGHIIYQYCGQSGDKAVTDSKIYVT